MSEPSLIHGPASPWDRARAFVPNVGDEAAAWFGVHAVRGTGRAADRYVHLRRVATFEIRVELFGAHIATITPTTVQMWTRGYGHSITTRDALSAVSGGRGFVYSHQRVCHAGGSVFREGITFTYLVGNDRVHWTMSYAGTGEPVEGAKARRRREVAR